MKFSVYLTALLLITVSTAYCQYNAGGTQFYIGPKSGVNAVRYSPGKNLMGVAEAYKTKVGYSVGMLYKFKVNDNLSLHGEFNYVRKTRSVKDSVKAITFKNKHIDAPILFELSIPAKNKYIGKFEYYFNIGPQISYWLKGDGETTGFGEDENTVSSYSIDFKQQLDPKKPPTINRFQYGFIVGSGLTLPSVGDNFFVLEMRYFFCQTYLGETYTTVINDNVINDDLRGNYHVLSLSLAYTFGLNFMPNTQKSSGTKVKTVVK